ncbi:MAG: ATP-binding protein [Chthoniobacterales bacterium]
MATRILPENISPQLLQGLIETKAPEGQTIEFKSAINVGDSTNKRKFAGSVAAFANASGGDIVFGAVEQGGYVTSYIGLNDFDADRIELQLRQVLVSNLDPMVPGLRFVPIEVDPGKWLLILRVPRSSNRPHAVTGDNQQFPIRDGNRRRPLRVRELRESFGLAASLSERMQRFRADRIGSLFAGESPLPLPKRPLVVVHLMPQSAFDSPQYLDVSIVRKNDMWLWPMNVSGLTTRINFDGFITFSPGTHLQASKPVDSYVQVFRNGCIESVSATLIESLGEPGHPIRLIPWTYEAYIEQGVRKYLTFLAAMNVESPIFLSLSIIHAGEFRLSSRGFLNEVQNGEILGNDVIVTPEVPIGAYTENYFSDLKEPFDRVWQAGGRLGSPNYANGIWCWLTLPS